MTAIDYSFARPSIASLLAAGVKTVFRYVGPSTWGKTITQAEYDALTGAGITVVLVFEETATDAEGGYNAGVTNGELAQEWEPIGYDGPLYAAVDQSIDPSVALPYIQGFSTIATPERTGVYGEGALIVLARTAGCALVPGWQSASTSFPGNAVTGPDTAVQQGFSGPVPGTDADTIVRPLIPVPVSTGTSPTGDTVLSDFPNAVAVALTPDGNGAWVAGSDGGIFAVGDAAFHGSIPGDKITLAAPIVDIVRSDSGAGYWLVGSDGGVFAFGDAISAGSYPGLPPAGREGNRTFGAGSLVPHPDGKGYTLVALDGARYSFGG